MNISSEISSTIQSNSSLFFFSNATKPNTDFEMLSVGYIISFLMSFPLNSYVIWLIVTGTGNGLAAEFFIFNLSVCEVLLCLQNFSMIFSEKFQIFWIVVFFLNGLAITGQPFFECLICVERYLAVVHPVTFLKYKPLRYRLMCSVFVWVITFATGGLSAIICWFAADVYFIVLIVPYLFFISIQLFCCLAVLRALKQSGPGERGREREREEENHMKRRAFNLILITTVTMIILYAPYIILLAFLAQKYVGIFTIIGQICFILAGLVQPVLFLYRVKKFNLIKCQ